MVRRRSIASATAWAISTWPGPLGAADPADGGAQEVVEGGHQSRVCRARHRHGARPHRARHLSRFPRGRLLRVPRWGREHRRRRTHPVPVRHRDRRGGRHHPRRRPRARDVLGIPADALVPYGHTKAKVSLPWLAGLEDRPDGHLVLVTAMSPTPAGEGKTTTSVGLADALRRIGEESIVALREPSMGPVFGIKGGAAGGGYAQVVPMVDINLAFTGDFAGDRRRQQPARRDARQPPPPGQRPGHRPAHGDLEAGRRPQRPGAARRRRRPRRRGERRPRGGRLRHRRRVRGHGDPLPRDLHRRPQAPPRRRRRRAHRATSSR